MVPFAFGRLELIFKPEVAQIVRPHIFMFVFTFDLLCDIVMVDIRNEVFI